MKQTKEDKIQSALKRRRLRRARLKKVGITAAILPLVLSKGAPVVYVAARYRRNEDELGIEQVVEATDYELEEVVLPEAEVSEEIKVEAEALPVEKTTEVDTHEEPEFSTFEIPEIFKTPRFALEEIAPTTVATDVPFINPDGTPGGVVTARVVTATTATLDATQHDGWWVVQDNVNRGRITVNGNVNLILADGAHLNTNDSTFIQQGGSLNIWAQSMGTGMGRFTSHATSGHAGIGTYRATLVINGGEINARGSRNWGDGQNHPAGAGIGGNGRQNNGTVTINGGIVNAQGSDGGAGIGGGGAMAPHTNPTIGGGGVVNIHGGKVTATGGTGASIGTGGAVAGNGGTTGNTTVTITGGTVIANRRIGRGTNVSGNFSFFMNDSHGGGVVFASEVNDTNLSRRTGGLLFEGDEGVLYSDVILPGNIGIQPTQRLTIGDNQTLTIPTGITLTNSGTIVNEGTVNNSGTVTFQAGSHLEENNIGGAVNFAAPSAPVLTQPTRPDYGQIDLSWTSPTRNGGGITGYHYSIDGGTSWRDIANSSASTSSHTITGLRNDTTYNVRVRAIGGVAHVLGNPSNGYNVTTLRPDPSVLNILVGAERITYVGTNRTVTIEGSYLNPSQMRVAAFLEGTNIPLHTQTPTGTDFSVTAILSLPSNATTENRNYDIRVSLDNGETWLPVDSNAKLIVEGRSEISIHSQPEHTDVISGIISESLTVEAEVTREATLAYQWQRQVDGSWEDISGARSNSLEIPRDLLHGDHHFRVVLTATGGAQSVISDTATVTVERSEISVDDITLTRRWTGQPFFELTETERANVTFTGLLPNLQNLSLTYLTGDIQATGIGSHQAQANSISIGLTGADTVHYLLTGTPRITIEVIRAYGAPLDVELIDRGITSLEVEASLADGASALHEDNWAEIQASVIYDLYKENPENNAHAHVYQSNNTGVFEDLIPNHTYYVRVFAQESEHFEAGPLSEVLSITTSRATLSIDPFTINRRWTDETSFSLSDEEIEGLELTGLLTDLEEVSLRLDNRTGSSAESGLGSHAFSLNYELELTGTHAQHYTLEQPDITIAIGRASGAPLDVALVEHGMTSLEVEASLADDATELHEANWSEIQAQILYVLYDENPEENPQTQSIASNTTGVFENLTPNQTYYVRVLAEESEHFEAGQVSEVLYVTTAQVEIRAMGKTILVTSSELETWQAGENLDYLSQHIWAEINAGKGFAGNYEIQVTAVDAQGKLHLSFIHEDESLELLLEDFLVVTSEEANISNNRQHKVMVDDEALSFTLGEVSRANLETPIQLWQVNLEAENGFESLTGEDKAYKLDFDEAQVQALLEANQAGSFTVDFAFGDPVLTRGTSSRQGSGQLTIELLEAELDNGGENNQENDNGNNQNNQEDQNNETETDETLNKDKDDPDTQDEEKLARVEQNLPSTGDVAGSAGLLGFGALGAALALRKKKK